MITSLGIRFVGPEVAKSIASTIGSFDQLLALDYERLRAVEGLGSAIIESLQSYIEDQNGKRVIAAWLKAGVNPSYAGIAVDEDGPLKGQTVLVTGVLKNFDREQAQDAIKRAGGKAASSVTKALSFAVVGDKAGAQKLSKLSELGVEVIDEDEFSRRLEG